MRFLAILAAACCLSGCSSLQFAGYAQYRISPLIDPAGHVVGCCSLDVRNGKEIGAVEASFKRSGDSYEITLHETGVQAFQGQATAATAAGNVAGQAVNAAISAAKLIK